MTAFNNPLPELQAPVEGVFSFEDRALEVRTARQREVANRTAIELMMRLETEKRAPNLEERQILLAYSGIGGTNPSEASTDGNMLGLLNEYYTPIGVTRAVWNLLERIGFSAGTVLEPSAGTGIFLETAPESAKFTAVELNPDAARINQLLHPNAEV
jgi:hypothetical protein